MTTPLPAGIRTRPDTWDREIFMIAWHQNEYRLPAQMTGWNVLDIGAHIGGSAWAAWARGAAKVICYEPEPANYALLVENTAPLQVVECVNAAIWPKGKRAGYTPSVEARNTGGGGVDESGGVDVSTESISDAVNRAAGPRGHVDLLKLDCEGAEWAILSDPDFDIRRIKRIVGEYHCKDYAGHYCNPDTLRTLLYSYILDIVPSDDVHGLFFAGMST